MRPVDPLPAYWTGMLARYGAPPPLHALARIPTLPSSTVGALTPEKEEEQQNFIDHLWAGLRSVTPTLIILGIATGASFAIGSGLVGRYVWKK